MVIVAMSAMMRNNPTQKTTLKITMSMMPTMSTALHRELQEGLVKFSFLPLYKLLVFRVLFGLHGVPCLLLDLVVRQCMALCSNAFLQE